MFKYSGSYSNVNMAVKMANNLLNNNNFYQLIRTYQRFDMSDVTNDMIAALMKRHSTLTITVKTYKPWWPWSKAVAMFKPSEPHTVYLSSRRLNRSAASVVGSLLHEYVHLVDNLYSEYSFGHGSNSKYGKENTAPYAIGTMAYQFYNN
jgi:hypothetical protein